MSEEERRSGESDRREPERRLDMVSALITSLNDVITSLRLEIKILGDGERHGRKRTYVAMAVVGLLIVLSLVLMQGVYRQGTAIKRQGSDIQRVVTFIESCQDPEGECSQRNQRQLAEAIRSISLGVFDSVGCVLATPPLQRTDATTQACRDRYFPK